MIMQCIGAGVMSSAFAHLQARKHLVSIYPSPFDVAMCQRIDELGSDPRFDKPWPEQLSIVDKIDTSADILVIGVSSQGIEWAIECCKQVHKKAVVILLTKGLIELDGKLISVAAYVDSKVKQDVFAITGPCIAAELANGSDTYVEVSGPQQLTELSDLLSVDHLSVKPFAHMEAACWLAALKNVYAMIISSHDHSANQKANIVCLALKELNKWMAEKSIQADMMSLSGLGDLLVTSERGRNGKFGRLIGQGKKRDEVLSGLMQGETVEGLKVLDLISKHEDLSNYPLIIELQTKL